MLEIEFKAGGTAQNIICNSGLVYLSTPVPCCMISSKMTAVPPPGINCCPRWEK